MADRRIESVPDGWISNDRNQSSVMLGLPITDHLVMGFRSPPWVVDLVRAVERKYKARQEANIAHFPSAREKQMFLRCVEHGGLTEEAELWVLMIALAEGK